MAPKEKRGNAEKIAIYSELFIGRTDIYGTYNPETGKTFQIKKPVTKQVVLNHLLGIRPYGMYMLLNDKSSVVVIDFDDHNKIQPVEFINQAKHYNISAYLEVSKSKGWHVWIFCERPGISAIKLRTMAYHILQDIECPNIEIFPKQNCITDKKNRYGHFINCPLFGKLVPLGKTIFVNPDNNFLPYEQWSFLEKVKVLTEKELDDLIEINEWEPVDQLQKKTPKHTEANITPKYKFETLRPCAQKMLKGVTENQRVICFRLAISLCAAGFDESMAKDVLFSWSSRNTPKNGKTIITKEEIIEQCRSGFSTNHTSYGCSDFAIIPYCDKDCHLYRNHQTLENNKFLNHQQPF